MPWLDESLMLNASLTFAIVFMKSFHWCTYACARLIHSLSLCDDCQPPVSDHKFVCLSTFRRQVSMEAVSSLSLKRRFEEVDSGSPYSTPKDSDDDISSSDSADSCDSLNPPSSTALIRKG